MQSIEVSKASDTDNLSGKFLEDRAEILAKPISEICNLSGISKNFPNACKVPNLKRIFRKCKRIDPYNYRPISLFPLISAILERFLYDQTKTKTKKKNNLLYNYRSGSRSNHSTCLCLSFLSDKIRNGFDEGLLTGMILFDLQKALDTINHETFLKKLISGLL